MEYNNFKNGVARLWNGENLSYDEIKELDSIAAELIDMMETSELDYDLQNSLDNYIIYYKQYHNLNEERTKNLVAYNKYVNENANNMLALEQQNRVKMLKQINSRGIISAITIIETVTIIGMLISFLAIVLLKK